jgi:calcineurin-like phosphoesterase family protein
MYNKNMATWLTSDLHFFHRNIITYCNRPFEDEYMMNDEIVRVWNESVNDGDRVIVVGDLTAGLYDRKDELAELVTRLRGDKVLVVGNHDHLSKKVYLQMGFTDVRKFIIEDGILYTHKPATEGNSRSLRLQSDYKPRLIVHGHIHAERPDIEGHFNVAWDRHRRMIDMNEIIRHVQHETQPHKNAD